MTDLPLVSVSTTFRYEAAHWLPNVPNGHQCGRMHGHSYELRVTLRGVPGVDTGWIADFADIKEKVRPWLSRLDHHTINDEIENPTVENQLLWWYERLIEIWPALLYHIHLRETATNYGEIGPLW